MPALCLIEFPLGSLPKMPSICSMGRTPRSTSTNQTIPAFQVLLYPQGDLGHDHFHPHHTMASRLLPLHLPMVAAMGSTFLIIWNNIMEWSQFRSTCLDFVHHPPTMEICLCMTLWRTLGEHLAIHQWEEGGDFPISAGTYPLSEVLILTMLPKVKEVVM